MKLSQNKINFMLYLSLFSFLFLLLQYFHLNPWNNIAGDLQQQISFQAIFLFLTPGCVIMC